MIGDAGKGISSNIYTRLREVLLSCDQFQNEDALKSLFVDQRLAPWRDDVPQEAKSAGQRVDEMVDFLYDKYNHQHENALVLLLHVLRDWTSVDDARYQQLVALIADFESASEQGVGDFKVEQAQPYLPFGLYREMLLNPASETIAPGLRHLRQLLKAVQTYCSVPILTEARSAPDNVQGQCVDATLLFADISGFTNLSEKLKRRGRAGAEEITAIVNDYFTEMVAVLHRNGGVLLKFGGDALLGMFVGPPEDTARYAVQAALDMQRAMIQFTDLDTSAGRVQLQMKVGLHTGRVFGAHLGSASQMEYWVTGRDVNITAMAEEAAQAGQVIASEATKRYLSAWGDLESVSYQDAQLARSFYVLPKTPWYRPLPSRSGYWSPIVPAEDFTALVERLDTLTPYLSKGVLQRLIYNPDCRQVEGEHRLVSVLFINVIGFTDLAEVLLPQRQALFTGAMQDYYAMVQATVEKYGGVVNKTDLYAKGDKLLVIFGAPIAHENDTDQAARTAVALHRNLNVVNQRLADRCPNVDVRLRQRIGLSTGYAFSGNIGVDVSRENPVQEYTIMGDEVNLAARLMSASEWGETWVSGHVYDWLAPFGEFEFIEDFKFKGKQEAIPTYRLLAMGDTYRPDTVFVDRIQARPVLRERLETLLEFGQGHIISVIGVEGIGKSRLWEELHKEAQGVLWLVGTCRSPEITYHLWASILRNYLNLNAQDTSEVQRDVLEKAIAYLFGEAQVPNRTPFLAIVLGLPLRGIWKERVKIVAENLPARIAKELVDFITRLLEQQPVVLVCENIHNLDPDSEGVLVDVLDLVYDPLLVGLTLHPGEHETCRQVFAKLQFKPDYTSVFLKPLEEKYAAELLLTIVDAKVPVERQADIMRFSGGNPLFIAEMGRMALTSPGMAIPNTLQALIESRVDALPLEQSRTLKAAAVIGVSFTLSELVYMLSDSERLVKRSLAKLREAHLIQQTGTDYAFVHGLARDVIYQGQNLSSRRAYHRRLGAYWEEISQARESASHYMAGELWDKALAMSELAADQFRESYANQEALRLYQQALRAAGELRDVPAQCRIHHSMGEIYYLIGQYEQAEHMYQQELGYWLIQSACNVDKAAVYGALGRVYDRWGKYALAIPELDRGLYLAGEAPSVTRAQLLISRCSVLLNLGREKLAQAEQDTRQALDVAQSVGARPEEAYAYNNLGAIYGMMQKIAEALDCHQKSLTIRRELGGLYDIEQSLVNVGTALFLLQRFDEAVVHFKEALELQRQIGDWVGQGGVHHSWGHLEWRRGNKDLVEDKFLYALSCWMRVDHRRGMAYAHHDLGSFCLQQERPEDARQHLERSAVLYQEIGATTYLPDNYMDLARACSQLEDNTSAIKAVKHALRWAKHNKDEQQIAAANDLLEQLTA